MGRQRRRIRRETPQTGVIAPRVAHHESGHVRSDELLARESANMLDELKRVALVSGVCFGMLLVLLVVDRVS